MDRLLYNFSLCKVKEEKRTLYSLKFSVTGLEKLKSSEKERLTDTAQNFFHSIQETTASTCGTFQIYFYKNLFDPEEKSSIIKDEFWTKKTIENLINEIFSTNPEENEKEMQNFKKEYNL